MNLTEEERQLVASGAMKLPEEGTMNWEEFRAMPSANLSEEDAMKAVLQEREESR